MKIPTHMTEEKGFAHAGIRRAPFSFPKEKGATETSSPCTQRRKSLLCFTPKKKGVGVFFLWDKTLSFFSKETVKAFPAFRSEKAFRLLRKERVCPRRNSNPSHTVSAGFLNRKPHPKRDFLSLGVKHFSFFF